MSWLIPLTTHAVPRHPVGVWRKVLRRRVKLIAEIVHEADLRRGSGNHRPRRKHAG